jgi:hypothetical protein
MRELAIEWRHYEKEGETCDRCAATGTSVRAVIADLTRELSGKGITLSYTETALPAELMAQSNLILFNGIALEEVLGDATAAENACPSCSCLTGTETRCRSVERDGVIYEEIPAELIRKAALLATGLNGD